MFSALFFQKNKNGGLVHAQAAQFQLRPYQKIAVDRVVPPFVNLHYKAAVPCVKRIEIKPRSNVLATPELIAQVNRTIDTYEDAVGNFAARTRQMIDARGYVAALSRLVQSPNLQAGFRVLRDRGELENTFEALVVRFPSEFSREVVEAAQWRLDNAHDLPR